MSQLERNAKRPLDFTHSAILFPGDRVADAFVSEGCMHPKKEEMLKKLEDVSRIHDASLKRSLDIALHPERFGWRTSLLTAAIVVPVTGMSAMLTDASQFLLKRSDDEAWDRGSPPSDSTDTNPSSST